MFLRLECWQSARSDQPRRPHSSKAVEDDWPLRAAVRRAGCPFASVALRVAKGHPVRRADAPLWWRRREQNQPDASAHSLPSRLQARRPGAVSRACHIPNIPGVAQRLWNARIRATSPVHIPSRRHPCPTSLRSAPPHCRWRLTWPAVSPRRPRRRRHRRRRDVHLPDHVQVVGRLQQGDRQARSTTSRSARAAASPRSRPATVDFGSSDKPLKPEELAKPAWRSSRR